MLIHSFINLLLRRSSTTHTSISYCH